MNKTALCIKMLQVLNSRKRISVSELAEILETNPRNIVEYKKELEIAGYNILGRRGRAGGYELDKSALLPAIKFTQNEKIALNESLQYLYKKKEFLHAEEFVSAYNKIMSESNFDKKDCVSLYNKFPLSMPRKEIKERYDKLSEAIQNRYCVKIVYTSNQNKDNIYIIHPYKLYLYSDEWFVLANNDELYKILHFKLNRIKEIEVLRYQKKFRIPFNYKESDYLDDFGIKNNVKWIRVKCIIKNNAKLMLNERIYGKNQIIKEIDTNRSIMTCTMKDIDVLTFFLSFGANCEIIEPIDLRNKLKDEIDKMKIIYTNIG